MGTVFISHSSKDNELVYRVADDIRALGHTVWVDQSDLPAGASLAASVQAGIEKSDSFLLLHSRNAAESGWVDLEWQAAIERQVRDKGYTFLLARLDDTEVPLILSSKKWIDLTEDYASGLAAIGAALGPIKAPPSRPTVWYFDDMADSLEQFTRRHQERFEVRTFSEIVDLLSALGDACSDPAQTPDLVLLDLYCPRDDADAEAVAEAERRLVAFVEAEEDLKRYVDAAWRPFGVEIVEAVREFYPPERLPIVMHTQEGLFLLRDELIQELERMGAGWLLKGRFSPETDRMVIERVMMTSGHRLSGERPRVLIIDDNRAYVEAFQQRQSEFYDVHAIETEAEVLRTLNRLDAAGTFPDVFIVDMYYPRGSDSAALERIDLANRKLREFAEVERGLREAIQASFEPLGLNALKHIRRVFPAERVPVLVYAQSGMLLLKDQNIQDIERLGGGWLLKGRYDARTEQTMILGELLRAGLRAQ